MSFFFGWRLWSPPPLPMKGQQLNSLNFSLELLCFSQLKQLCGLMFKQNQITFMIKEASCLMKCKEKEPFEWLNEFVLALFFGFATFVKINFCEYFFLKICSILYNKKSFGSLSLKKVLHLFWCVDIFF